MHSIQKSWKPNGVFAEPAEEFKANQLGATIRWDDSTQWVFSIAGQAALKLIPFSALNDVALLPPNAFELSPVPGDCHREEEQSGSSGPQSFTTIENRRATYSSLEIQGTVINSSTLSITLALHVSSTHVQTGKLAVPYLFVGKEEASLHVDVEGNYVTFTNSYIDIQLPEPFRIPYRVKLGEDRIVNNVIYAANEFNRLLSLYPETNDLIKDVKMEFLKLPRGKDQASRPAVRLVGEENLCIDGKVDIISRKSS
ncbi:1997_t:CDS:2, partial [Acaulospora colombiana]